ncbi:MAG TPA: DNA-protecting protein DprA [Thermosulfurimonas dismutans]|uniref:DNA-protecting protein DprA n=1 Tax=Thermosulfurimonas dismutans TaxID=999894 RepID=A0A7C3GFR2_9BACT|nr:DNA-protecting protein DprA [Thermosulfurimonas dismutans]
MDLSEDRLYLVGLAVLKGLVPVVSCSRRSEVAPEEILRLGRDEVKRVRDRGYRLVFYPDREYPEALRKIPDPPAFLYVRGRVYGDLWGLGVVGARKASPYGLKLAREWSREVAARGTAIISGLALGVDAEAHKAALSAGGYTVAVLGSGLDVVYPSSHRRLAEDIVAAGGALVSEFPLGSRPERWHFPRRNRIIAGLSRAVLVVEAAEKSGALITARLAAEMGREVLAVPGSVFSPQSRGTNELLKQGAWPATEISDVLEALGLEKIPVQEPPPQPEDPLLACIPYYPKHFDEIMIESGLEMPDLAARLLELELAGFIQSLPGRFYQRVK